MPEKTKKESVLEMELDAIMQVECPACGALPTELCSAVRGNRTDHALARPHIRRMSLYRRHIKESAAQDENSEKYLPVECPPDQSVVKNPAAAVDVFNEHGFERSRQWQLMEDVNGEPVVLSWDGRVPMRGQVAIGHANRILQGIELLKGEGIGDG